MEEDKETEEAPEAPRPQPAEQSGGEVGIPQCEDGERRSEPQEASAEEVGVPQIIGSSEMPSSVEAEGGEKAPALEPVDASAIAAEILGEESEWADVEAVERGSELPVFAAQAIGDPQLIGSSEMPSSVEAEGSEKVLALEPVDASAISADDDEILGEESEEATEDAVEPAVVASRRGGRRRKRGRGRVTLQRSRSRAPLKMKKGEEGLCFICFDGGDLVVCDHRGCPKVYHPECVNRDEAYFQAKGQWSCGWHICSNCQKSASYKCFTCTYSLCRGCIKEAKFSCIRGSKGLCEACMRMVLLIEKDEDGKNMDDIDFNDKNSWEYLFKDYWIDLKSKLSLTVEELTSDRTPSKGPNVVCDNESSEDLDDACDDQGASSQSSSGGCEKSNSSRRKVKRRPRSAANKEGLVKEIAVEDTSTPENVDWASKERKVRKRLRKVDKEDFVKEVAVESTSVPQDNKWASKERKVKKRLRKIADKEGSVKETAFESTSIPEDIEWASKELLEFVEHMKDGDRSVLSHFDVQALLLEYIKRNNLRDRHRKGQIICDSRLQSLFGKSRVGHIEMLKLVESHFLTEEASPLITDDNQGGVVDPDPSQMDAEGISDASTRMSSEKRRKQCRMLEVKGPTNFGDYAAIDVHNINLMYLRRNLMEDLIDNVDMFNEKVIGSFVRIRVSGSGQRQDVYRLVQVVGSGKAAEKYKTGKRTTDITLEILNLDKREVITIDTISNQAFTEEECRRLRQSIKCGFISRLTVGEVQEKARVLQAARVNDLIDSEKSRLGHLRDRASEKGHRKELRECVEKLDLLNTPEESMRRLNEVPEIHADPNMDPDYESADDEGDSEDKRPDDYNSPRESSFKGRFKGRELVSPGKGGSTSSNNLSATLASSKITWESNRSASREGDLDVVADSTNKVSSTQGNDVQHCSSHVTPKPPADATSFGSGVQSPGCAPKTTPAFLSVNSVAPSTTSETEKIWHYQDPSGKIQGPFSMTQLRKWNTTGYFPTNLRIWRASEKQEDSILLTDALIGKFHKDLPQQEPQHNSTVQPTKDAAVMDAKGHNWDGGWRGNNHLAWTDTKQNTANWKPSQTDTNIPAPQLSSSSTHKTGVLNPAEGRPTISSRGWDSSNGPNTWSGRSFDSSGPVSPFGRNTYHQASYRGREDRVGRNTGRWNGGRGRQDTWNSNRPMGLRPSGQGNGRQHLYWNSSSQQFPRQHWQGQPANDSSNQLETNSFYPRALTPNASCRDQTSVQVASNTVSPVQTMCSGWNAAPRDIEAQQSLTATKEDNQQNSPFESGRSVILGNEPPACELLLKDGLPSNGATVFSGSSSNELMGGFDKNQFLGSNCANLAPKQEQAISDVLGSEPTGMGNPTGSLHDEHDPEKKSPGSHDRSASESRTVTVDGGISNPTSAAPTIGICDPPASDGNKGDALLKSGASAEVAGDFKLKVESDGLESVSSHIQETDGSNVNPRPPENMCEQTQSEKIHSQTLEPCNSGKGEEPSDTKSNQWSRPSLGSAAKASGCEPAVALTSGNSQMGQFISCEPLPPNSLHARTPEPLNTGCGTGANGVQNPGWAVAPQNPNPGPGAIALGYGNMPYGAATQGSANLGWGMAQQGTTNMPWGTPANLNMGWGPPTQPSTNANTVFGLLAQGNPNVNLAWGPPAQGNTNPNAGLGAPMQGNATVNAHWVAPAQGNMNSVPGWVAPIPGNTNQNTSWVAPMQGNATLNPTWGMPAQGTTNLNPGWVVPTIANPDQNANLGTAMQGNGQGMQWNPPAANPNSWSAQQEQTGGQQFGSGNGAGRHSRNRMQGSGGGGGPSQPPPRGQRGFCWFFQENGYCKKGANCEYLHQ